MMKELKGYNAAVTGGAAGIGREIALELLRAGAKVSICDVDSVRGEQLAQEYGIDFTSIDVRDGDSLLAWFEELEPVDILVNNVGVSEFCPLQELDIKAFDRVIATNLRPAFILSQAFAKQANCEKRAYGRIVNIASTRHLQSEVGSEAYAASKGGIVSLTHALAVSLSSYKNTTVNCISPGWIDTTGNEFSPADHAQHPSGRIGKVEDIARTVRHLCHIDNDFINGQDIIIDGGMTRKMIYL